MFAAISGFFQPFQDFKIIMTRAAGFEAFRAVAAAEFFGGQCQMAAAAAQPFAALRQQHKMGMAAFGHYE